MRRILISAASLLLLLAAPGFAGDTDGKVEFSGGSVAAGIGYSWGDGTLTYQGKQYPFTIKGLSIVDVGASKIEADGTVEHLMKVEDFEGNFTAITAGATIAGGASATVMENQHGVVMHVTTSTTGLQFQLAPSGITVAFKR